MAKISHAVVEAARPRERQYFVWDRDLKGFGLRVSSGGTKSYVVQYRMGGRGFPVQRFTIGKHGSPWTALAARDEAKRLLSLVGLGQDPKEAEQEREHQQLHNRFDQFADQFLDLYGKREWAARNYDNQKGYLDRWIIPVLGKKAIGSIKRKDIISVLDRVPSDKPSLPRNLFVLMRRMFSWAVERGELEQSPLRGMKAPKAPAERHHILAHDELIALAAYAPKLGKVWGNFVHLLLLTGQRLREVAEADWAEFDRDARTWTIPRTRTKNSREQIVPLNAGAMAALDEIAGVEANASCKFWPKKGFVFSHKEGRPISGFSRFKRRLDAGLAAATAVDFKPWRLHDLRRTVATNMQQLGVRFEVTEALLNHVSITHAGVASVYHRHDWADEKRAALDAWSAKLAELAGSWDGFVSPQARVMAAEGGG